MTVPNFVDSELFCFTFKIHELFLSMQAITGLNGMQLGEKKLIVQRASVGAKTNMNNVRREIE